MQLIVVTACVLLVLCRGYSHTCCRRTVNADSTDYGVDAPQAWLREVNLSGYFRFRIASAMKNDTHIVCLPSRARCGRATTMAWPPSSLLQQQLVAYPYPATRHRVLDFAFLVRASILQEWTIVQSFLNFSQLPCPCANHPQGLLSTSPLDLPLENVA